ncbi:MAG TPA: putative Ig domain-containing protein, partial [Vicinamibacterales bacterium]|nr:putative Ig domain-containing protein [Vicinamibacterales bacterium]
SIVLSGCQGSGGGSDSGTGGAGGSGGNGAPRISGSPPTEIAVDEHFSFSPRVNDPDGDALTFSIAGKPDWAKFNSATGRLHGKPRDGDVGIYTNIRIMVSDGNALVSLPAFDIVVDAMPSDSVTLSWYPPTQNADGSPLTDLAGYRIYVGRRPGALTRVIPLHNPGLTRYVVENLRPAVWHFAMTSVNSRGRESARSATVRKAVG